MPRTRGSPMSCSAYTRVVANLWAADQQGLQLGLLAPGWLHGCLGLNFAFKRTCRVRMAAGEEACPSAGADERATLDRIGAPADVRLACQLRPRGNVSIIPLVRTEQPIYRATAPQRRSGE